MSNHDQTKIHGGPFTRPEGLDTRLDGALAAQLDAIDPSGPEALQVISSIMDSINAEFKAIDERACPVDLLDEPRRIVYVTYWIEAEINNGGLSQYFFNSSGDNAAIAPELVRTLGELELVSILERANACFPNGYPTRNFLQRYDVLEEIEEEAEEKWEALDAEYHEKNIICQLALIAYIREHKSSFYKLS